jgi:hypothetical protein
MEEVTPSLSPPRLCGDPKNPSEDKPNMPQTPTVVDRQSEKTSETTVALKSSSGTRQLTERVNQLSDFLEDGHLVEIAFNPAREKERLALESYLGYVRRLLEGMAADDGQAARGHSRAASQGKPDQTSPPKAENQE